METVSISLFANVHYFVFFLDKIDFVRDVLAYMVVVGTVIGVAFDGYVCAHALHA